MSFVVLLATLTDNALAVQSLTASWLHEATKNNPTVNEETVSYTFDIKQELTEAMFLQEAFRYNRIWRGPEEREEIDPSMRFAIKNDLFLLDLFGAASEQQNSLLTDRSQLMWEATWASSWQERFLPKLRASYGRNFNKDDASPHLQDTDETRGSMGMDWDLELFKTHYNFNRSHENDDATLGETTSTTHFARLDSSRRFFDNRLSLTFSQQYSASQTDSSTAVGPGGFALVKQNIAQVMTGHDDKPLTSDPGKLGSNSLMADGNLEVVTGIYTDGFDNPPLNIAIRVDLREINQIYLYTQKDIGAVVAGSFIMDLYGSINGTDYQRIRENVPFIYNSLKKRFELMLNGVTSRWLKLVVTSSPLQRVDFTEIEAYVRVVSSEPFVFRRDKTLSNISTLNMGYKFSSALGMTYNLSFENGNYSSDINYRKQNHIGEVRWALGEYLTSALGFSQNMEAIKGLPNTLDRVYSLRLSYPPVPSVDMNWSLSKTERYLEKSLFSTTYETGLYTSASIYPDLNANFEVTCGQTKYENTKSLVLLYGPLYTYSGTTTSTYGTRLTMTARLMPRLTADLTADYQNIDGAIDTETLDNKLTLNWRVSDILSFLTTLGKKWEGWRNAEESFLTQITLAPTDNTQFSISYYVASGLHAASRYAVSGSWAIGPHLTLQENVLYVERKQTNVAYLWSNDKTDWQVTTQLIARF